MKTKKCDDYKSHTQIKYRLNFSKKTLLKLKIYSRSSPSSMVAALLLVRLSFLIISDRGLYLGVHSFILDTATYIHLVVASFTTDVRVRTVWFSNNK